MSSTRFLLPGVVMVLMTAGALGVVACSGGSGSPIDPPVTSPNPLESGKGPANGGGQTAPGAGTSQGQGEVKPPVPPAPTLEVSASIVSATLGDDCQLERTMDLCAPSPDGNGCGTFCQQSNVQLLFKTGAGTPAKVTILSVTLHDPKDGTEIDKLTPRSPRRWVDNAYAPWDETLAPSSEVRASYDLTAPKWQALPFDGAPKPDRFTLWRQYRMHVTLKIGETTLTLESAILDREPPITT